MLPSLISLFLSLFLLIGTSYLIGSLFLKNFKLQESRNFSFLLAFGTGVLLSINFVEFYPMAFSETIFPPIFFVLLGIFFVIFMESYVGPKIPFLPTPSKSPHHQHHIISHGSTCSSLGCVFICGFFDGVQIGSSFLIDTLTGWVTSFGLFFHVLPDFALISGLSIAGGVAKKKVSLLLCFLGLSIFLGAFLSYLTVSFSDAKGTLIPFAAGILTYTIFTHLLPNALKNKHAFWALLSGSLLFSLFHVLFHQH